MNLISTRKTNALFKSLIFLLMIFFFLNCKATETYKDVYLINIGSDFGVYEKTHLVIKEDIRVNDINPETSADNWPLPLKICLKSSFINNCTDLIKQADKGNHDFIIFEKAKKIKIDEHSKKLAIEVSAQLPTYSNLLRSIFLFVPTKNNIGLEDIAPSFFVKTNESFQIYPSHRNTPTFLIIASSIDNENGEPGNKYKIVLYTYSISEGKFQMATSYITNSIYTVNGNLAEEDIGDFVIKSELVKAKSILKNLNLRAKK